VFPYEYARMGCRVCGREPCHEHSRGDDAYRERESAREREREGEGERERPEERERERENAPSTQAMLVSSDWSACFGGLRGHLPRVIYYYVY